MINFYGHDVFPLGLGVDFILAIVPILWLTLFLLSQKKKSNVGMVVFGYLWLLYLPNSLYLVLEFRHIILVDNIADGREPLAVLVFGLLALFGLFLTLKQILIATTKIKFLAKKQLLSTVVLCFMTAWGSVLGLNELKSIDGLFYVPSIISLSLKLINTKWLSIGIVIGTSLSALSILTLVLYKNNRKKKLEGH